MGEIVAGLADLESVLSVENYSPRLWRIESRYLIRFQYSMKLVESYFWICRHREEERANRDRELEMLRLAREAEAIRLEREKIEKERLELQLQVRLVKIFEIKMK